MFLKKIISRTKLEWKYYTKRPWSLKEVGEFWDTVEDYDKINDKFYTYMERFSVSKNLFFNVVKEDFNPKHILDIQTRSGNGTVFWNKIYPNSFFTCVDFSSGLLKKAETKTIDVKNRRCVLIENLNDNEVLKEKFQFILCYETIEHVYEYSKLLNMLSKILEKNGIIILTTPNVSWEIIHWLTAIVGYNHSEGPHRFLLTSTMEKEFKKNNLEILKYTTSIFLPFNNKISISLDKFLAKILPKFIKKLFFLRHIYILKKN